MHWGKDNIEDRVAVSGGGRGREDGAGRGGRGGRRGVGWEGAGRQGRGRGGGLLWNMFHFVTSFPLLLPAFYLPPFLPYGAHAPQSETTCSETANVNWLRL